MHTILHEQCFSVLETLSGAMSQHPAPLLKWVRNIILASLVLYNMCPPYNLRDPLEDPSKGFQVQEEGGQQAMAAQEVQPDTSIGF